MLKLHALRDTIAVCEAAFRRLENLIPDPVQVRRGTGFALQYEEHNPRIVVVQKLSRVVTGLRSCLVLLEQGLHQEVYVIFRLLNEFHEDVWFMCEAIRSGECTPLQQRFIADFFQPEFDHENPLLATQKRDRVPRKHIQAALARIPENTVNPSDTQESARTITNTYSGYVHGASEHILDMYDGYPPRYQLAGMRNARRQKQIEKQAFNYFYNALQAFTCAAGAFGLNDLLQVLFDYIDLFEKNWGKTEWENPEELLKTLKPSRA